MSDAGGTEDATDYSKMKVNDLKKLLKNRGLATAGNKQDLIDRLQSTEAPSEDLLDGSEVGDELVEDEDLERELDESTLLIGDEVEKTETKTTAPENSNQEVKEEPASSSPTKTVVVNETTAKTSEENTTNNKENDPVEAPNTSELKRKISLKPESTSSNDAAKKKLRAERFGAGGEAPKKDVLAKRAERFAINSTTTSTAVSDKTKLPPTEALKKRAERFGILSPAEQKRQQLEKLQARKLRFASLSTASSTTKTTTTATATIAAVPALPSGVKPTQLSAEERKKLRAQRFSTSK